MPGFLVDASTLLDVRDTLGALHHQLLAIPAVAGGYEGGLGSPALEAQVAAFSATCRADAVRLGERIDGVMRGLAAAAAAYERADAAARHSGSGWAIISVGPHGVKVVASGPGSPPAHRPGAPAGSGSGTTTIGGGGGSTTSTGGSGPRRTGSHSGTGSGTVTIG